MAHRINLPGCPRRRRLRGRALALALKTGVSAAACVACFLAALAITFQTALATPRIIPKDWQTLQTVADIATVAMGWLLFQQGSKEWLALVWKGKIPGCRVKTNPDGSIDI